MPRTTRSIDRDSKSRGAAQRKVASGSRAEAQSEAQYWSPLKPMPGCFTISAAPMLEIFILPWCTRLNFLKA